MLTATALHWLPADRVAALYAEVRDLLRPGGVFVNADHMPDEGLPGLTEKLGDLARARREARYAAGAVLSWEAWWDHVAKDPTLGPLVERRNAVFAEPRPHRVDRRRPPGTWTPCAPPATPRWACSGAAPTTPRWPASADRSGSGPPGALPRSRPPPYTGCAATGDLADTVGGMTRSAADVDDEWAAAAREIAAAFAEVELDLGARARPGATTAAARSTGSWKHASAEPAARWRAASYSTTEPAVAALSELAAPPIGMRTISSAASRQAAAQPLRLVADQQHGRAAQVALGHVDRRALVGADDPRAVGQAGDPVEHRRGRRHPHHRHREQRPGAGPHRLRVVRVGRVPGHHHARGAERVGRAHQRADVARRRRPVEDHDERARAGRRSAARSSGGSATTAISSGRSSSLPPSSAIRSGARPTAGASTAAIVSRAHADRVPPSGKSKWRTSQPYDTARLIGRTPWTRNSAARWRLVRLPTSDCHRWNDALRVVIFNGLWPPFPAEPTVSRMDVRLVTPEGVETFPASELPTLLKRGEGIVWVDVPAPDDESIAALGEVFGFHPMALRDLSLRNPVPKVHLYPDHAFVVLHGPQQGAAGHVHYIELDQFIGPGYLVTVHGPINAAVDPQVALLETRAVVGRLERGRLKPATSYDLSYAIVSALTGRLRDYLGELTREVWKLEQRVTGGHMGNPEDFLEELFGTRHGLLTVRTMATLSREVYGRMAKLEALRRGGPAPAGRRGGPVRPDLHDGRRAEGLPAGRDRVLPDPHQHEDDDRRGTARRDRRRDAAGHRALVDPRDEPDRQRPHALPVAGLRAVGHGGHVDDAADLGQAARVVVSSMRG